MKRFAVLIRILPARRWVRFFRVFPLWLIPLFLLGVVTPTCAQIFQVQAGSSSLFDAHGGSVEFKAPAYEGWVGFGSLDEPRLGAFLRTQAKGYILSFGDDVIDFGLPTDVFNSSYYFFGRGIGVARPSDRVRLFGFAGTTSTSFAVPFFRAASPEKGAGLFFLDTQLTPTLRAFSRNVLMDKQSSINGLEWMPRPWMRAAVAGGQGSNQGYFASSFTAERDWISVRAAYIRAGDDFRRIVVSNPLNPEMDRENILVTLKPKPFLLLSAGRQTFLQPGDEEGEATRGTVNQYQASFQVARFTLSGALFDSQAEDRRNKGMTFSVGRSFAGLLHAQASLLHSRPDEGETSTSMVATVREILSPRLSLLQLVTVSKGQTTASFGGNFLSNRLTIGVEYQTLFIPFATGNQFKQALVLNLRLHPFGNLQFNAGTSVAPDGAVRYTAYGSEFLYSGAFTAPTPTAVTIHKHVVRGRVTDEEGHPLRGVALRIDDDIVFTNSRGEFFVRKRKARSYPFAVLVDQFLLPGRFQVVAAPAQVTAAPEDRAAELTVILRRIRDSAG